MRAAKTRPSKPRSAKLKSPGPQAPGPQAVKTMTVEHPQARRILLEPQELHFFEPFLARESTVSDAAAFLNCKANSLLARVRRFIACGLLEVARTVPRAGRAVRVYRSTADLFFVPLSGSSLAEYDSWNQSRLALLKSGMEYSFMQPIQFRGHRVYRDEHGVVSHMLAVSATENNNPLLPNEPAMYFASHDAVYLNFEDAKRLQAELDALLRRYANLGGGQRHLLWLNLVPLPKDA
jgi:hypothetical protein